MAVFLDELQNVPGVYGACLYHSQEGVLQSNLPSLYTDATVSEIGKVLARIHTAGQMNFSDLTDVSIRYDETTLLLRKIAEEINVFAILDPDCNQNLVTMSLNIIQQELKGKDLFSELSSTPSAPSASAPQAPTGGVPSAEVEPILTKMQNSLAEVLGPMAALIFDEAVDDWKAQGGGSKDSLPALIQLISEEIGDDAKAREYRSMIQPIL